MKRPIIAAILTLLAVGASATPDFIDVLTKHYSLKAESKLVAKSCGVCHKNDDGTGGFNAYGDAIKKAGGATDASLATLGKEDSDKDGNDNDKEFAADTLPGDPTSGAAEGVAPPPKEPESVIPKNGFHPAVVHFPIGLFVGGLILDFLGMIRKDKTLLQAGWYNILFAAVSCFGGIASGFLAAVLMKLPFSGTVMEHIWLALGSTVAMFIMIGMRFHCHEEMKPGLRIAYYILAVVALATISMAGHVGGVIAGTS